MSGANNIAVVPRIEGRIQVIHGLRVMVDVDLAALYGVQTKRLNEQVKRNRERSPVDFLFQLTAAQKAKVVANCDHLQKLKFSKVLPYVFTEHGAIQATSVLASTTALGTMIAGVLHMHDGKRWTQAASSPSAAKPKAQKAAVP